MRPKYLVTILVLLALAAPASPAHASGVVSVCDEAHLLAALAGGGTVTFSCSGTITLTSVIWIEASTTLDGSGQAVTISGNHAVPVFYVYEGVTLNLNRVTVANGNVGYYGGGISNQASVGLTVIDSTFSGNSAGQAGGGISNHYSRVTLKNTIVANSPAGGNCYSIGPDPIADGGGNLSYPDTTCPGINGNPLLGPLQINGGPTQTMEPGPASAALDAGNDATCAAAPVNNLDQRGVARPQGKHCDIGAVERLPYRLWFTLVTVRH